MDSLTDFIQLFLFTALPGIFVFWIITRLCRKEYELTKIITIIALLGISVVVGVFVFEFLYYEFFLKGMDPFELLKKDANYLTQMVTIELFYSFIIFSTLVGGVTGWAISRLMRLGNDPISWLIIILGFIIGGIVGFINLVLVGVVSLMFMI